MTDLLAVDRLDVSVIVDNVTDSLSTNPNEVVPEWIGLSKAGRLPRLSGRGTCCARHGLSLLLTAHLGHTRHTVLFDAGPEGATFLRNAAILGVDPSAVGTVVLSHGHWDHAGGLMTATEAISKARGPNPVDCFVHPGMFAVQEHMGSEWNFGGAGHPFGSQRMKSYSDPKFSDLKFFGDECRGPGQLPPVVKPAPAPSERSRSSKYCFRRSPPP